MEDSGYRGETVRTRRWVIKTEMGGRPGEYREETGGDDGRKKGDRSYREKTERR